MSQIAESEPTASIFTCDIPGDSFPKEYKPVNKEPKVITYIPLFEEIGKNLSGSRNPMNPCR